MKESVAISVQNVSKTFRIPHEKVTSIKGAFVQLFKKNTFEEFKALDNVSFEVKKGEFFGIIGRNGSGKSTLLKVLAGIYHPDKGAIKINGLISPFLELGIGFNPELSGRDNVYLNATVLGLSKKQIDQKFDSIVEFSELKRFIDQKLKNYSSGMQVRLAFSVAIHANRDILLMDEVLAVGDSNFQSKCLEEFNKYREMGRTVVIVTHDILAVQKYCDKVLLLRNGKVEKSGKPEEVVKEYSLQNIEDEESKAVMENKKKESGAKNGLNKTSKTARIANVEFLNSKEEKKKIFQSGEKMTIRVHFNFYEDIKKPLIGIAIFNSSGLPIYGTNNYKRKKEIDFVKKGQEGFVEYIFEEMNLLEGRHKVNVAIGKNSGGLIAQSIGDYTFFVNKGLLQDYGVVNLKPNVKIYLN